MVVKVFSAAGEPEDLALTKAVKNNSAAKRQIVCTRGIFPTIIEVASGASTRYESHIYVNTGKEPCTGLQLHYAAWRSRDFEDSTLSIADFSLQASVSFNNQFCPLSVGGTTTTPVQAGATQVTTNPVGVYLPPNTEIKVKTGAIVATAGLAIPAGLTQTLRTKKVASIDVASQVFSRFDISNAGGRVDTITGLFPLMITGIPANRHVAIAGWGDSLMAGVGDVTNNTNGAMGWFEHSCMNVNGAGQNIPFTNLSKSGDQTNTYDVDESFARFAVLEYVTHVIFGMGNNDIMAGRTLLRMQTAHLEAWAHAKLFGCKVGAVTLTPRTTSTDNWATVANQTPMSGYTTAGIRGQFNAWLVEQWATGVLDFIVDINSVAADTINPDVFKAGFSYDGTHWNAGSTLTVAAYAKTQLLKLKV